MFESVESYCKTRTALLKGCFENARNMGCQNNSAMENRDSLSITRRKYDIARSRFTLYTPKFGFF